ncbi:Uma2 family endonuclease [Thiocapsa sp.]|uniref:Uma2 family endonuclease n=1 Tax=Thiocapsa sp. TaxID=2024551 RepID=UPI003593FBF7
MSSVLFPADVVDYPDSDGQPMAESDFQREPLMYAVESLRIYFRDRSDVYVSGNMFVYYEQGNPKAVVAPDVFAVMGAPSHDRASYKLWQEPKAPDFVLEITSKSTYSEDQGAKRGVYALLGVKEYWQYDPTGDYLEPRLQGLQLIERNYWPLPVQERSGSDLRMRSAVLGLDLWLNEGQLRFHDPATGEPLRSHAESELARRAAEQARQAAEQERQNAEARAEKEARQCRALEARLAELEQRLRR